LPVGLKGGEMGIKDKVLWCLSGMFIFSLFLNIFLIKNKVEINFVSNRSVVSQREVSPSAPKKRSIFSKKSSSASKRGNGYYYDFENRRTNGWKGVITSKIVPAEGGKYALEVPRGGNKYFAAQTFVEYGAPKRFKIDTDTKVKFDYYLEEASVLRVQMYCPSRRDNFYFDLKNPTVGQWDTFVLDMDYFSDNSHTGATPQRGDVISNIQIYGGYAGEDTVLVIDNVEVAGIR